MNMEVMERNTPSARALDGKVALITGSTSGIGLGVAHSLTRARASYSTASARRPRPTRACFRFVKNTGKRDGAEIAEVYASLPALASEPPKRLVGFSKVPLKAGESKEVSIEINPK